MRKMIQKRDKIKDEAVMINPEHISLIRKIEEPMSFPHGAMLLSKVIGNGFIVEISGKTLVFDDVSDLIPHAFKKDKDDE